MKSLIITSLAVLLVSTLPALSARASVTPSRQGAYTASKHEYTSSTIIHVFVPRMDVALDPGIDMVAENERRSKATRDYFEAQKKAILSNENLGKAIRSLMPHAVGDHLDVIEFMKAELKVKQIEGTDLLNIIVRSANKEFSRDFSNQIAESYLNTLKVKNGVKVPIVLQKAKEGILTEKKEEAEQNAELKNQRKGE